MDRQSTDEGIDLLRSQPFDSGTRNSFLLVANSQIGFDRLAHVLHLFDAVGRAKGMDIPVRQNYAEEMLVARSALQIGLRSNIAAKCLDRVPRDLETRTQVEGAVSNRHDIVFDSYRGDIEDLLKSPVKRTKTRE